MEDDHRRGRGVGVGHPLSGSSPLIPLSLSPSLTAFSPRCLTLVVVRCRSRSPLAVDCSCFAPLSLSPAKPPLRVGFLARANKGNLHGDPDENGQPPPQRQEMFWPKLFEGSWNFPSRNFRIALGNFYFVKTFFLLASSMCSHATNPPSRRDPGRAARCRPA